MAGNGRRCTVMWDRVAASGSVAILMSLIMLSDGFSYNARPISIRNNADATRWTMRLMKTTATVAVVLAAGLVLSGCPASMSGGAYSRDQAREAQEVRLGYVRASARF